MSTITITLQVAGRELKVEVPAEQQELVLPAAELLEDKLQQMQGKSDDPTMQLLWASLNLAGSYLSMQQAQKEPSAPAVSAEIQRQLQRLTEQLRRSVPTPIVAAADADAKKPPATDGDD